MMSTITTKQKFEAAAITKKAGKNWRDLKLGEVPIKDGSPMVYDGEELMQGMPVFVETETEAGFEPYPDGVYTLEDGRNIEIVEGFVAKISEAAAEAETANPDQEQEKILTPEQEQAIKKITETHTKETIFEAVKKAKEDGKTEFEASVKAEVEKQVEEIKKDYDTKLSEHNKTVDDLTKVVQSLLDVLKGSPADKPAEKVLTEFQKEEKRKEDAKLAEADKLFQHTQKLRKQ
jgi:hypothetical protein